MYEVAHLLGLLETRQVVPIHVRRLTEPSAVGTRGLRLEIVHPVDHWLDASLDLGFALRGSRSLAGFTAAAIALVTRSRKWSLATGTCPLSRLERGFDGGKTFPFVLV